MTPVQRHPRVTRLAALGAALALLVPGATLARPKLEETEERIRDHVRRTKDEQLALLERVVDIPSGTLNLKGVRQVGDVFREAFDALGFQTRWVEMPPEMGRAGHLVAEHPGKPGTSRLLLIGHLDTVHEGPGQELVREGPVARGAGTQDMSSARAPVMAPSSSWRASSMSSDAS